VRHGRAVAVEPGLLGCEDVRLLDHEGALVGIGRVDAALGGAHPRIVLASV
jgi:hypothetical protein